MATVTVFWNCIDCDEVHAFTHHGIVQLSPGWLRAQGGRTFPEVHFDPETREWR